MKAAVIYENGGPDVLRYEDVPDPECPDGCVLIDVEAISIEGGDLLARAGSPPPSVPHIVGYLAAGTVVEVGAGVEDRAVGDRVVTLNMAGSHASKRAVPAMSTWPIPDGLDAARRRVRPGRVRDRPGVPVHRRQPRGRADGPDPRGSGRRRDGRDPARQAGRRDRDLDRVQRREARAPEGVRARPRDQLRDRELRRANARADRRARRRRDPRLGRRPEPGRQHRRARLPRDARQRGGGGPRRLQRRGAGSCGRRTTRCAASSSAGRC